MINLNIPIKYYEDPISPNELTFAYVKSINVNEQEYYSGQLLNNVMEDIAKEVEQSIPDKALIIKVGTGETRFTKVQLIQMLMYHDDQLAAFMFKQGDSNVVLEDKSENSDDESASTSTSVASNSEASTEKQFNNNESNAKQTEPLQIVHVQKSGHRLYSPIDLAKEVPDDVDYINQIGMSRLTYRFHWSDIKDIIKANIDKIFTNPIAVLLDNSSITANRRKKFAVNTGFDDNGLDNYYDEEIGTFDSEGKSYKLVVFYEKHASNSNKQEETKEKKEMNNANDIFKPFNSENNTTVTENVTSATDVKNPFSNTQQVQQPANQQPVNQSTQAPVSNQPVKPVPADNKEVLEKLSNIENMLKSIHTQNETSHKETVERLDQYQKTADEAYTLSVMANQVDYDGIPEDITNEIKSARKSGTETALANCAFQVTELIKGGTRKDLLDAALYLKILTAISHE